MKDKLVQTQNDSTQYKSWGHNYLRMFMAGDGVGVGDDFPLLRRKD